MTFVTAAEEVVSEHLPGKKQTLHLRFRRMDLVRKLNAMAGGRRLTPTGEE